MLLQHIILATIAHMYGRMKKEGGISPLSILDNTTVLCCTTQKEEREMGITTMERKECLLGGSMVPFLYVPYQCTTYRWAEENCRSKLPLSCTRQRFLRGLKEGGRKGRV